MALHYLDPSDAPRESSCDRGKRDSGGDVMATKYLYLWIIQGNYGQGWEDECAEESWSEARTRLREYRENSPYPSRLIQRRELREVTK